MTPWFLGMDTVVQTEMREATGKWARSLGHYPPCYLGVQGSPLGFWVRMSGSRCLLFALSVMDEVSRGSVSTLGHGRAGPKESGNPICHDCLVGSASLGPSSR